MTQILRCSVLPQWDEIEVVRDKTVAFCREQGLIDEVTDAVAMVTSELLENANKYGTTTAEHPEIEVRLTCRSSSVTVEVRHDTAPGSAAHLLRLDRMIQWIRSYQDPFQAYLERLREVSTQSLEHRESCMGLVRIAYEGRSIVDFFLDEDNTLTVSAVHPL